VFARRDRWSADARDQLIRDQGSGIKNQKY
jgi:hypothetical protein